MAINLEEMGKNARIAFQKSSRASSQQKNDLLLTLADQIWLDKDVILSENQKDIEEARQSGLSEALIDRLTLNDARLTSMLKDVRNLVALPDPVGEVFDETTLPNGLKIHKQRVALGVIAVIYESRPNVTVDVASLALKSGNTVILRGGHETLRTNSALVSSIHAVLEAKGLPKEAVQFIADPDRTLVTELLKLYDYIDMVIPRGGANLHRFCREHSLIPVITGGMGICHLFVDDSADQQASLPVIRNAKIQRPTVCNALDTVVVHRQIADSFIPTLVDQLRKDGVSFRADPESFSILSKDSLEQVQPAGLNDFDTEWLSLVLGIKVVEGLDEAIDFISRHSSGHSDGILTQNEVNAKRFLSEIDSAAVYVNASTRFTDGGQFGLGAEVAISTQRLHARGPMGLRELTTYKWVVIGQYHVRG